MVRTIDLTGKNYGYLTVVSKTSDNISGRSLWNCICKCGNTLVVKSNSLRTGNTKSCGCYHKERVIETSITHGMTGTKIYRAWTNMKRRCDDESNDFYKDYGGRGITYCTRWKDFVCFYDDMIPNYFDGASLERVDVNGNYCKDNCTWIDLKDQAKNRRKPSNNTSGCVGVDEYTNTAGVLYYRVRWVEDGKQKAKYFSTKKFGNAFELATEFRKNKQVELGYGAYHGS